MSKILEISDIDVTTLRPGAKIVEGGDKDKIPGHVVGRYKIIPVRNVDPDGCDRTHLHVNDAMCYHRKALVTVAV